MSHENVCVWEVFNKKVRENGEVFPIASNIMTHDASPGTRQTKAKIHEEEK